MPRHDLKGKENQETLPEFEQFMQLEEIESHDKVPVTKISFSKGTKVAFWFLRIYIAVMVILVIIGFARV